LLLDAGGFAATIEALASEVSERPDLVAGIEARGFIVGAALAHRIGTGLLLIRKEGKLPGETIAEEYTLEYGTDRLVMHVDACAPGASVLLVDDLIATGGTALAATRLIARAGASVIGACFVIDLPDLGGSERLRKEGFPVRSLIAFEGD
jgi:adenine phosphoribosyltransferase